MALPSIEQFRGVLNTRFRMQLDTGGIVDLDLVDVRSLAASGPAGRGQREAFSIVLRSHDASHEPQRIYRLEHEQLGPLDLFLVPIGPDETGMRYEAVFN